MQMYDEMVDSGIDWLGKIPKDWEIKPLFSFISEKNDKNIGNKVSDVLSLSYGKIIKRNLDNGGLLPESFETYQIVEPDDIILRLTDLQNDKKSLRVGRSTQRGIITSAYVCIRPTKINSRYLYYLLHAYDLLKVFYNLGGGLRQGMKFGDLKRLPAFGLSNSQQQQIADFLDSETAKIDDLIAKQERLLELLEEKRRATITHAVTRGLDSHVELKETNIPWLGRVPSQWTVLSLRHILRAPVTDGPHETPIFTDRGVPFLSVDSIKDGELDLENVRYISREDHIRYSKKALIEKGDILMGKAASTGKIAQVKTDVQFSVWSPLAILKFNPLVDVSFVEYVLKSDYVQYNIDILCTNNTQKNISMRDIPKIFIALPNLPQQKEIAENLDFANKHFSELKQKIQTQITLLRERRTSLISNAVTGKLKI